MIPHGLHGLVRCAAIGVERASLVHGAQVLVVGQDAVCLVTVPLVAESQCVVCHGHNDPVVGADDALIVICCFSRDVILPVDGDADLYPAAGLKHVAVVHIAVIGQVVAVYVYIIGV